MRQHSFEFLQPRDSSPCRTLVAAYQTLLATMKNPTQSVRWRKRKQLNQPLQNSIETLFKPYVVERN